MVNERRGDVSEIPDGLQYSEEHEWVRGDASEGAIVTVGITAYAADALGDVVYAEPPAVGDQVAAGEVCGELESTKAVSDLYSPVTGTVTDVNPVAEDSPERINADPYGEGWIFKVELSKTPDTLIDAVAYADLTE